MPRGGARPGAGRKPKAVKFAPRTAAAEQAMANRLDDNVATIQKLADGGHISVRRKFRPAGLIETGQGEARKRAFPDLDPLELVVVEETTETLHPNLAAATYLVDRVMGKPTERSVLDLHVTEEWDLSGLSLDDLRRLRELAQRARGGPRDGQAQRAGRARGRGMGPLRPLSRRSQEAR